MMRKYLIRKGAAIALGVAGFLLVYGTAGASDNGLLAVDRILLRCAVGLIMLVSAWILNILSERAG